MALLIQDIFLHDYSEPDVREGSEQSNGDQSEGGQVDAECEARSEELGAAEEHGNPEEQNHLELAAAIVAWGE